MADFPIFYALLWAAVSWVLYKGLNLLYIRRQHAIKSRKLACEPAPLWPATQLGISTIKQMMAAQKAGRFPTYLREREEVLSTAKNRPVHTMRLSILGNEAHFTSDPKNIQALLATQFKDFGLGSARIGNFGPLMGDGIVGTGRSMGIVSANLERSLHQMAKDGNIHEPCFVHSLLVNKSVIWILRRFMYRT
jgi:hypothetical protein